MIPFSQITCHRLRRRRERTAGRTDTAQAVPELGSAAGSPGQSSWTGCRPQPPATAPGLPSPRAGRGRSSWTQCGCWGQIPWLFVWVCQAQPLSLLFPAEHAGSAGLWCNPWIPLKVKVKALNPPWKWNTESLESPWKWKSQIHLKVKASNPPESETLESPWSSDPTWELSPWKMKTMKQMESTSGCQQLKWVCWRVELCLWWNPWISLEGEVNLTCSFTYSTVL